MQDIVIDRRSFWIGALAGAGAAVLADSRMAVADELTDWLTLPFTPGDGLLPADKGELPVELSNRLGRFVVFIVKTWELADSVEPKTEDIIADLFTVKANEAPSYLAEYALANESIERARVSLASEERAFDLLAFGVFGDDLSKRSRLERFRRFVFAETARYLIAAGGFRRFKPAPGNAPAKNYQGYIAGPFTNPAFLPYRGITS